MPRSLLYMYTCRANPKMNLVFKQSPFVSNPLHSQYQAPSSRLVPFRANTIGQPCQFTIHSKAYTFKLAKVLAITNIMSSQSVQPRQYPHMHELPALFFYPRTQRWQSQLRLMVASSATAKQPIRSSDEMTSCHVPTRIVLSS